MPKIHSKTGEGKLKVSEVVSTEAIQEYTYEELEAQILQCETSIEITKGHLKFYKDLLKEADKVGVTRKPIDTP